MVLAGMTTFKICRGWYPVRLSRMVIGLGGRNRGVFLVDLTVPRML